MRFLVFDTVKSQLAFPVTSVEVKQQSCDWINLVIVRTDGSPFPRRDKVVVDLLSRSLPVGFCNAAIGQCMQHRSSLLSSHNAISCWLFKQASANLKNLHKHCRTCCCFPVFLLLLR